MFNFVLYSAPSFDPRFLQPRCLGGTPLSSSRKPGRKPKRPPVHSRSSRTGLHNGGSGTAGSPVVVRRSGSICSADSSLFQEEEEPLYSTFKPLQPAPPPQQQPPPCSTSSNSANVGTSHCQTSEASLGKITSHPTFNLLTLSF